MGTKPVNVCSPPYIKRKKPTSRRLVNFASSLFYYLLLVDFQSGKSNVSSQYISNKYILLLDKLISNLLARMRKLKFEENIRKYRDIFQSVTDFEFFTLWQF